MKSILLTITFLAAVATAKCETPATAIKEVKTEQAAPVATPADATAKTDALVGTSKANLSIVREGVKQA